MSSSQQPLYRQRLYAEALARGYPDTFGVRIPARSDVRHLEKFIQLVDEAKDDVKQELIPFRINNVLFSGLTMIQVTFGWLFSRLTRNWTNLLADATRLARTISVMVSLAISMARLSDRHRGAMLALEAVPRRESAMNAVVSSSYRPLATRNIPAMLDELRRRVHYGHHVDLNEMDIRVTIVWERRAGNTRRDELVKAKGCIIGIHTFEVLSCFFQCLALQLKFRDAGEWKLVMKAYKRVRSVNGVNKKLEDAGIGLLQAGDTELLTVGVSERDILKYERVYGLSIHVIDAETLRFVRVGRHETNRSNTMFLLRSVNDDGSWHFDYVRPDKVHCLWDKRMFCLECMKTFANKLHNCQRPCLMCEEAGCAGKQYARRRDFEGILCGSCRYRCIDESCLAAHERKGCKYEYCDTCQFPVPVDVEHKCGKYVCKMCKSEVEMDTQHHCKILKMNKKQFRKSSKYIYYDFECAFRNGEHIPVYIAAAYHRGSEVMQFTSLDEFCRWVFEKRPATSHDGYTLIAHNAAKYDLQFIKRWMVQNKVESFDVFQGSNVLYTKSKNTKKYSSVRFIDSIRFIPMALRKIPATFGFSDVEKSWFPYRFFTMENLKYKGSIPHESWFEVSSMPPDEYAKFHAWHQSFQGKEYDIWHEMQYYCDLDVRVLKRGCIEFRDRFLKITENVIDPFQSVTIAGVCLKVFKHLHYDDEKDAIYRLHDSTDDIDMSLKEMFAKWVQEQYYRNDILTGDEFGIPDKDAVVVDVEKPGYPFKQDIWRLCLCHRDGCKECYTSRSTNPYTGCPLPAHTTRRVKRRREYESNPETTVHDYKLCQWVDRMQQDSGHDVIVEASQRALKRRRANYRGAFYGGRTEPVKLIRKVEDGERIHYDDYTSLYPSVQSCTWPSIVPDSDENTGGQHPYPIGVPRRFEVADVSEVFQNGKIKYFGFMSCDVECPQDLYLPLLPSRGDGKLVFDLKPKTGCWTTAELQKAVELGYRITKVHEVVHFEQRSFTLFKSYVDSFLKMKLEAAGWKKLTGIEFPTLQQKQEFVQMYKSKCGIALDIANIGEYNPGMYFISKLCLNSLWGKFAQRTDQTRKDVVYDDDEFENVVFNDSNELSSIFIHDGPTRTVTYKKKHVLYQDGGDTSLAVAMYTTAYGRLRLYQALEVLGDRVLYMDTDSVIYVAKDDEQPLKRGPFLGDLTSELDGDDYITEFYSTGPKCYTYVTKKGKRETKLKGFSIKGSAAPDVEDFYKMIIDDDDHKFPIRDRSFLKTGNHHIYSRSEDAVKMFGLTMNKRSIQEARRRNGEIIEVNTLPFS